MTDIHCHILSGVDDGPADLDQSLSMLRVAYDDGIRTLVATPHYDPSYFSPASALVLEKARTLRDIARESFPDMTLLVGNECAAGEHLAAALACGECLTLGGTNYVLTEFSSRMPPKVMKQAVIELTRQGYLPVIAHCERLLRSADDIPILTMLRDQGCLLQHNADAVPMTDSGWYGFWSYSSMADGTISFVSTDAHNTTSRKPVMKAAFNRTAGIIGHEKAERVFKTNAEEMLGLSDA